MAYVPQQLPENEQNQFGSKNPTTPNPIPPQTGGSSGTGAQAQGGTGAAPGVGTSTQFGSNAAKLTDYLTANAPQIQGWGQDISNKLNQTYGDTMSGINSAVGNFNQQVGQGYQAPDQNLVNQAATNPTAFVQDPNAVKQFQGFYNNTYSGPDNIESTSPYASVNSNVNKAVQDAALTQNPSGLGTFLNNFMGANDTTQGMQTLDSALLTGNKDAYSGIKAAAQPYQGLNDYLGQQTSAADQTAANAKTNANASRSALQNQFTGQGGIVPTLQQTLNDRLTSTKLDQSSNVKKAVTDYQGGKATPDELKMLGFDTKDLNDQALANSWKSAQALQQDYGVNTNFDSLFNPQDPNAVYRSPGAVATPDEVARTQALGTLTGQDLSGWLGQTGPAGPMVSTNKQALGDLGMNLGGRDQATIANTLRQFVLPGGQVPFGPGVSDGDVLKSVATMSNDPNQKQYVDNLTSLLFQNASSDPTLKNALARLGFRDPGAAPPPANPKGVVTASSTPGVF